MSVQELNKVKTELDSILGKPKLKSANFSPGQINPYPVIDVYFKTLARTAIQKGQRGILYAIMKDSTNTKKYHEFTSIAQINESDWTEENFKLLQSAFEWFPPYKLVVRNMDDTDTLSKVLLEFENRKITHLSYPAATLEEDTTVVTWVKSRWERQGIVYGSSYAKTADDVTIVYIGNEEFEHKVLGKISAQKYSIGLMGAIAGCPLNRSLDNAVSPNLVSVDDISPDLGVLNFYNDDGKVRVNLAINSKTTYDDSWKLTTRNIKTVEGMNIVRFDIMDTFRNYWLGLYLNTYENKMAFCNLVNKVYFANLIPNVLSPDYINQVFIDMDKQREYIIIDGENPDEMSEIAIKRYPTGNDVYLQGDVRFTGVMVNLSLPILM